MSKWLRGSLIALGACASVWLFLQARNWVEYVAYGLLIVCSWAAKIHTIRKAETPFESLVKRLRRGSRAAADRASR
jgi:hypothetical protein